MSKATKRMQKEDLAAILEQSRTWNEAHGLTGMLLYIEGEFLNYNGGRFMQVLEGTEVEVKAIFTKIKQDDRHHNVILLNEDAVAKRSFDTWLMGFESMSNEAYGKLPGSFQLDDNLFRDKQFDKFNLPINFLRSFYEMNAGKRR